LFGGHLAWTAHLLGSYFAVSLGCQAGAPYDWTFALLRHAITVAAAAVAIAAGLTAYAVRRRVAPQLAAAVDPQGTDTGNDPGEALRAAGRTHHLAGVGVAIDAFFLFAIILGGAANFFVRPCQ
jgi:hypothetical protein